MGLSKVTANMKPTAESAMCLIQGGQGSQCFVMRSEARHPAKSAPIAMPAVWSTEYSRMPALELVILENGDPGQVPS